jgi:hypothetical protein
MESDTDTEIDTNKIDEAALALLYITMHNDTGGVRAWKNIDWDVMDRLYEKGYIFDPKNKAKSVSVTVEGEKKSKELFYKLFRS